MANLRNAYVNNNHEERDSSQAGYVPISSPALLQVKRKSFGNNKRICPLAMVDVKDIDYKNLKLLKKFVSEMGKIIPSRITSVSQKKQRKLAKAIKIARNLALLPFVAK